MHKNTGGMCLRIELYHGKFLIYKSYSTKALLVRCKLSSYFCQSIHKVCYCQCHHHNTDTNNIFVIIMMIIIIIVIIEPVITHRGKLM